MKLNEEIDVKKDLKLLTLIALSSSPFSTGISAQSVFGPGPTPFVSGPESHRFTQGNGNPVTESGSSQSFGSVVTTSAELEAVEEECLLLSQHLKSNWRAMVEA